VITLVLGGARSGKSAVAERLVSALGDDVTYVATAADDPTDADFAQRTAEHRARRPPSWKTIEAGPDLPGVLAGLDGPVLVDSLGTWVAGCHGVKAGRDGTAGSPVDVTALCDALRRRNGPTVVVSEEVGLGVHPSTDVGRRFRDTLGLVNAAVADVAGDVWLVVAGRLLPLTRADG
jgi:adenosylcobinamide kinase / adenosylcobinamide-phosphate guanylyltransferase